MKICDDLRQAVLQAAIQGKLTTQRKEDGDARELLKQIQKSFVLKQSKIEIDTSAMDFDIPDNWAFVELNQLYQFVDYRGKTPNKSANGIPLVTASNIKKGFMDYTRKEYISEDEYNSRLSRGVTELGDILFTTEAPMGNTSICELKKCSCGQRVITFKQQVNNTLSNKFFMYCLLSNAFENQLKNNATGTTAKGIKAEKLRHFLIPLPPLAEQQRIVAKVDKLMAEIDELEKVENELIALKEAFPGDMKASLLQAAMQGKLTTQRKEDGSAKELLKQITEEKARLVKEGKLKKEKPLAEISEDEILFDIPENWEWVRLNDLVVKNVKRGKSPTYSDKGRALVFAQKCNVKTGGINIELALHLDDTKLAKYPEEEYMQDADIVVNSTGTGTMGRVGLFRDTDRIGDMPIVPDSHVTVVRFGNVSTALYMYYYLKSQQEYLEENGDGSTNQKELKPLTIMNLLVPLPPLAEQERIVAKLDKLLPLCDSLL